MQTIRRTMKRFVAAYNAFRDEPPIRYVIVEKVHPLGWCVLHVMDDYHATYAYREEHFGDSRQVRVMTETEWRRRTLATMWSRDPWIALGQMNSQLLAARSDLADEVAIHKAALLGTITAEKQR